MADEAHAKAAATSTTTTATKAFAPKTPVQLNPPKHDPISKAELAACDGMFFVLFSLC